jgi:hypothetical protein
MARVTLRILTWLGLLVSGMVFGMLGTIVHSSTVGTADLPWGVVVALLGLACLLAGVRLLTVSRWETAVTALGALIAVIVLAQQSFGGSVLVQNAVVGWTWMIGAALVSLAAIVWPAARRATSTPGDAAGAAGSR